MWIYLNNAHEKNIKIREIIQEHFFVASKNIVSLILSCSCIWLRLYSIFQLFSMLLSSHLSWCSSHNESYKLREQMWSALWRIKSSNRCEKKFIKEIPSLMIIIIIIQFFLSLLVHTWHHHHQEHARLCN